MKFIHAADLHIESPYKGISNLNAQLGKALIQHGIDAYNRLIELCINERVDFLLIAGDSFDSDSGSLGAQYRFFRGLERLNEKGIKVYIICGNHDPLNQWAKNFQLPENVIRFQADEVQHEIFEKEGESPVSVYGVSYGKKEEFRNLAQLFKRTDNHTFAIGILHGTMAGNDAHTPYCPFSLDDLRASNMDYWALGHIHKREILHESNPMVVYSGNLQGRHFNESGEKGCYCISLEHGKINEKLFKPLSKVVFHQETINVSGAEAVSDIFRLFDEVRSRLLQSEKCYMLRIELTGVTEVYHSFTQQEEIKQLLQDFNAENDYTRNFVFLDRIINHAFPKIDLEERKSSSDFIADLLNRFEELEQSEPELKELQAELFNEISSAKVGRFLKPFDDSEVLQDMLNVAKWKCIRGLINQPNER